MKVSIVIPVTGWNKYLDENIRHCLLLNYPDYEILILPDNPLPQLNGDRMSVFPTGHIGPAAKRNIGVQQAKGEIIAFIDDDTYPERNWLKNAVRNFEDKEIAAVGGPAVTPPSDTIFQLAGGAVYSSLMGGGVVRYRYIPLKRRLVDDYPSCNFIVRKDVLNELGRFQTNFWPGEDTALCLDIVKKLNKKIVYEPEALVYHHRRSLFRPHLKQIKAYALHRGYFAKRFPRTSLRLSYFLPSMFFLFLIFGWLINVKLYFGVVLLYLILTFVSVARLKTWRLKLLTFMGIIATHITYGVWFIKGLFSRRLQEE